MEEIKEEVAVEEVEESLDNEGEIGNPITIIRSRST